MDLLKQLGLTNKSQTRFQRSDFYTEASSVPNATNDSYSNTLSLSEDDSEPYHESISFAWQNGLILCSFSLIIIVSLAGNLLVCKTLMSQRRVCDNSTNVLIGVLAISDLIMTTFNIPFTVVDIILKDWIFGGFFCTLVSFVQANSVYVSSFTMAVIAINRWNAIYQLRPVSNVQSSSTPSLSKRHTIVTDHKSAFSTKNCCWPLSVCPQQRPRIDSDVNIELQTVEQISTKSIKPRCRLKSKTKLCLTIMAIWVLAALHSLPHTIFNRVRTIRVLHQSPLNATNQPDSTNHAHIFSIRRCVPDWPQELGTNFGLILTLFTTITQYFIPLSCAGAIYTRIGFTIMSQGKVGQMSQGRAEKLSQKKRRRLLMLVLIVAIFALCWLPFNVYYLLLDFGITKSTNYTAFLVCLWLATSSVCYNPFVYCWLNEHFRREAKIVIQRVKGCFVTN